MWRKKTKVQVQIGGQALSLTDREQAAGPRPADIDHGPTRPFLVILRHGMPTLVVQGHGTDFGDPNFVGDGRGNLVRKEDKYTKVWVSDPTTWYLGEEYTDLGKPKRPKWFQKTHNRVVLSVRTDDVVMVLAKDNVEAEQAWPSQPSSSPVSQDF